MANYSNLKSTPLSHFELGVTMHIFRTIRIQIESAIFLCFLYLRDFETVNSTPAPSNLILVSLGHLHNDTQTQNKRLRKKQMLVLCGDRSATRRALWFRRISCLIY